MVGVGEDAAGQPSRFAGLTASQAKSFDPTVIGNYINKYADPKIDFTIERPLIKGKRYAIFVVRPFRALPHVCTCGFESELLLGVFYIRTADAASRPAIRSSEIHGLVQRALRNQRELLGRMIRGVLYESSGKPDSDLSSGKFNDERLNSRKIFSSRRSSKSPAILTEISVCPDDYVAGKHGLSELKQATTSTLDQLPSMCFVSRKELRDSYFTNVALRSLPENELKMWQVFSSGLFNYLELVPLSDNSINYDMLVRFFAEGIGFTSRLYAELGYDEEMLNIQICLERTEDVAMRVHSPANPRASDGTSATSYVCRIPKIKLSLQRTAADLVSGRVEHAARIIKEVCERFNLPEGRHLNLSRQLQNLA